MDDSPYSELKSSLASVPAKALNFSTRQTLTNNLDIKQVLPSRNNFARDYRGLAELMGFQYNTIKKFSDSENPTMKILDSWETHPDATLDKLISYLEEMERHDVIMEITPYLEKNAKAYFNHRKLQESSKITIQVPEETPGPMIRHSERGALTRDDLESGEHTIYDAYVSYADEDCEYVAQFANFLETEIGLKLFIRGRDMLAGCAELDTNIELIKNRCRHMLIILTPNFEKSPACEFQVSFAGSLAVEQRKRILIPVIVTPCQIPLMLSSVSKIDFTRPHILDWNWGKLITSLAPDINAAVFQSSLRRSPLYRNITSRFATLSPPDTKPVITFPESTQMFARPIEDSPSEFLAITSGEASENGAKELVESSKVGPPTKKLNSFMTFFKRKGHSSQSTSSNISTSSGATSGFHSQSRDDIGNSENDVDNLSSDTSL